MDSTLVKESLIMNGYSSFPEHTHDFGQGNKRPGETRTIIVVIITAVTMVVEIASGLVFGSMALLADGLHMGSHAMALGISVFAYVYSRRHAYDDRFNFGTGKVNALGGFTGAVLLAVFALMMAWESVVRLITPVQIEFNHAIFVAAAGFLVNFICMRILTTTDHDKTHHHHHHEHDHADHHHHHHDHNLKSAYLHVLADALTSVFAIGALLSGKFLGWLWLDPFMGVVGALMVGLWSRSLLRETAQVLLDMRSSETIQGALKKAFEGDADTRVKDVHIWSIGPGIHAATIALVSSTPGTAKQYHDMIPNELGIVHATIEVHSAQLMERP